MGLKAFQDVHPLVFDVFSEVTEQELLDNLTSIIVNTFVPLSRVEPDFTATWAFIVTYTRVAGFGIPLGVRMSLQCSSYCYMIC